MHFHMHSHVYRMIFQSDSQSENSSKWVVKPCDKNHCHTLGLRDMRFVWHPIVWQLIVYFNAVLWVSWGCCPAFIGTGVIVTGESLCITVQRSYKSRGRPTPLVDWPDTPKFNSNNTAKICIFSSDYLHMGPHHSKKLRCCDRSISN